MLWEWLTSLSTITATPAARSLGYHRELAALAARHRRCRAAWRPHVEATRQILLEHGARHGPSDGCALLLGSALLDDIPWQPLLNHFRRLRLADIAFPLATRIRAARSRRSLELRPHDLTGMVGSVVLGNDELPRPCSRLPDELLEGVTWIASVNCLSQLPLVPTGLLLDRRAPESRVEQLGQAILLAHLEQLSSSGLPWCLIAEWEDRRFRRDGRLLDCIEYGPLLEGPLQAMGACLVAEWTWAVHPCGELPEGESEVRRVRAWCGGESVRD